MARDGESLSIDLPNLSAPSPYHEARATSLKSNKNAEEPTSGSAVISAALEPHGTVRSTKRARIVGVALELYYSKIASMPTESKLEFCQFASSWAGHHESSEKKSEKKDKEDENENEEETENEEKKEEKSQPNPKERKNEECGEKGKRIPLPWELFVPTLRIVGHCLLGQTCSEELSAAAMAAARGLHERAMHDMDAQTVLAARSLLRLGLMGPDKIAEPSMASVYSVVPQLEATEHTTAG